MSYISLITSTNNPVTEEVLLSTLSSISPSGLKVKESDVADQTAILAGAHEIFTKVLSLPDYVPAVDEELYPRKDVHRPTPADNPTNAWAWKVTVEGKPDGLLKGRTICLKDNITLKGVPCLLGTEVIEDWTPNIDATVVTRALEAGATITGKAVCENMSFFGASVSSSTGLIYSAQAKGYSAGGSSSGCGALVGGGLVDLAIGGDQGGSIRIPAACNGIVGMKPTHGLCPYTGIAVLEATIDTTGPMTRTVLDNALLLEVMAGADGIDDRQLAGCPLPGQVPNYAELAKAGVKGLKIGIISESLNGVLTDTRYAKAVVEAAERFKDLGAEVEQVSLPGVTLAPDIWMVIARLSAFNVLTGRSAGRKSLYMNDFTEKLLPLTQEKIDKMWPSVVATLTNGAYGWEKMHPTLMGKAMNQARKFKDEVDDVLSKYDLLITPTMARLPARIDDAATPSSPLGKMKYVAGVSWNTCPFSMTGHPAISIPVGKLSPLDDPDTPLPVGMQIIGKFYDEGTVYAASYAWEQANDWTKRSE